jgi:hypothetical protein
VVTFDPGWVVVMGAVDENADAWNTIPFIIEVWLNSDALRRRALCMVRQTQPILVEIFEKCAFEG